MFTHQSLLGIQIMSELCTPHLYAKLMQINETIQRGFVYHKTKAGFGPEWHLCCNVA